MRQGTSRAVRRKGRGCETEEYGRGMDGAKGCSLLGPILGKC